jgi:Protein of unknown function (DUF3515)
VSIQRVHGALPRPVYVVMIALPLLLAVAAAVIALVGPGTDNAGQPASAGSLVLPAVPAPAASGPECAALLAALPDRLQSGPVQLARRPLADPAPQGTAAWGVEVPVILRCGLDRPSELTPTAVLLEVSGVRWLRLPGTGTGTGTGANTSTWVAADRPVYVALTLSDDAGTGPLQDVSAAIRASLAERPVQPVR